MSLKRKKKSLLLPLKSDKNDNNKKTLYCYSNNLLFLNPHVSLCISNKICKNDSIINSEVCFQKKKTLKFIITFDSKVSRSPIFLRHSS